MDIEKIRKLLRGDDMRKFNPTIDLISLHYDNAGDRDDAHSAAADKSCLVSLFGLDWVLGHVTVATGMYGTNADQYSPASERVMRRVWRDGHWLNAHRRPKGTVKKLAARWKTILDAGGHVYVKEGGQSDVTAKILDALAVPYIKQIHVIQHSAWNEQHTNPTSLNVVKRLTQYVKIPDANSYLKRSGGDSRFVAVALKSQFKGAWKGAFDYYPPTICLDFSDTGELLYILGYKTFNIDRFRRLFLEGRKE